MTDNQFYVLITVMGAGLSSIGLAIRFSASRIIKALDDNSTAMLANTASNAVLSTKIDGIAQYVREARDRQVTPPIGLPQVGAKGA